MGREPPPGRLSCPHCSGVWGTRSRPRMARTSTSRARMGKRKRTRAVYHQTAWACSVSQVPRSWGKAWKADPSFRGRQTGRGLQDKRSVILYHRDWRKQAGVKGETAGLRNDSGGPLLKMRYGQPCSGVRGGFPLPLERPSRPLPWSWLCMSSMVWAAKSKSLTSS